MTSVFEALAAVRRELKPVGKDSTNQQSHYNFRGIDAVVNAAGPKLAAAGINIVPSEVIESRTSQIIYGSKNARSQATFVRVRYAVYGPDGDSFPIEAVGEAYDSGDKATPKAMAVAWRTVLIQALMLPTDEPDPDAATYDGNSGEERFVDWRAEAGRIVGPSEAGRQAIATALSEVRYAFPPDGGFPPPDSPIWQQVVIWLQNQQQAAKS